MSALLLLILIPLIGASFLFLMSAVNMSGMKVIAFLISLIPIWLLLTQEMNEVQYPWFSALSIDFHLRVDAVSYLFLCVTALIVPIALLSAHKDATLFFGLSLLLQAFLFIFFSARDLALFTIFWESSLLPLYFIIAYFGKRNRKQAALKFILYMIAGSSLLVLAVLALYFAAGSFNMGILNKIADTVPHASFIFAIFMLAFAVKTPLFPFHGWLSDTYYEASTAGTILLAAVLSKAGIYGVYRIGIEMFPEAMKEWRPLLLILAVTGVLYGGFAAWMQKDYKRLIAYSSFSHVNFILAGFFALNIISYQGALLQAFNHAVTITGLFLVASFLENRIQTTSLYEHRGLLKYMPKLCWLSLIFALSSVALPGTNNFTGELLIFLGIFDYSPWLTIIFSLTIIISVLYMLRYMELNFFGKEMPFQTSFKDLGAFEVCLLIPLIVLIFLIGIYPNLILKTLETL